MVGSVHQAMLVGSFKIGIEDVRGSCVPLSPPKLTRNAVQVSYSLVVARGDIDVPD